MNRRRGYNPKRKLAAADFWTAEERKKRTAKVRYGGNREHKLNPGDYALGPSINPRPGKTLCDANGPFPKTKAEDLLKKGISKGMISEQVRNGWPQNVWAVSEDNEAFEAQLENADSGVYHGYPMPQDDDFRSTVLAEWPKR
jgi:hypothetical protein